MQNKRIGSLNTNTHAGKSILYVMSRDQRVNDNYALRAAQDAALDANLPLIVQFNVLPKTGVRTQEQYLFMLDGLKDVEASLAKLGIGFALTTGSPSEQIMQLSEAIDAAGIYFDFNPLRGPRKLQKTVAAKTKAACFVVDTHNVIPLWELSDKEEFAAHTIRNKVHKQLADWLVEPQQAEKHPFAHSFGLPLEWDKARQIAEQQESTGATYAFTPGQNAAEAELATFISDRLPGYAEQRNVPTLDQQSNMSPYLHYGHISALRIALEVQKQIDEPLLLLQRGKLASYEGEPTLADSVNAFVEELIVRKELADNYCFYNPHYDSIDGAKPWGRETVEAHEEDAREFVYNREEWEQANTHDEPWNAAQREMMRSGKMHGYMRMYWAKKILEFSKDPRDALATAIYLNDKYSIDGGDPNGYTGIMWSILGIHDRPWFEREVFGKIRYMNRGGLERRFDVEQYMKMWS